MIVLFTEGLDGEDLGRVIFHHKGLNNNAVIPLQKLSDLNSQTIMDKIESILQSDESLPIDDSFFITVGTIEYPKGGGRHRITQIRGEYMLL